MSPNGLRGHLALALTCAVLVVSLANPRSAHAHANFKQSDPAPNAILATAPDRVRIWFTEEPDLAKTTIDVYDVDSQRLGTGPPVADPSDPAIVSVPLALPGPGVYTVAWQNVSVVDGDEARGYFAFAVGLSQSPALTAEASPQAAGGLLVALTLNPPTAGVSSARVLVRDADAQPVEVQLVRLRLTPPLAELGEAEVEAKPVPAEQSAAGTFEIRPLVLGLPGDWQVQVLVRRAGASDVRVQFSVPIAPPTAAMPAASPATSVPLAVPGTTLQAIAPEFSVTPTLVASTAPTTVAPTLSATASQPAAAAPALTAAPSASPSVAPAVRDASVDNSRVLIVMGWIALIVLLVGFFALLLPRLTRRGRREPPSHS